MEFLHHCPELVAVLCQVDDSGRGAQNFNAVALQICRQIQRSLSAELGDDAQRLFFFIDAQYIFESQGFEVQFIGGIIVGGYGLRVAVYDNRLKAQLL